MITIKYLMLTIKSKCQTHFSLNSNDFSVAAKLPLSVLFFQPADFDIVVPHYPQCYFLRFQSPEVNYDPETDNTFSNILPEDQ